MSNSRVVGHDKNGHVVTGVDCDLRVRTLRQGGAVCLVQVQHNGAIWYEEKLISAREIAGTGDGSTSAVRWALRDMVSRFEDFGRLPGAET